MNWLKGLPTWAKWALGVFAALVVLGVIGAIFGEEEGSDSSNEPTAAVEKEEEEEGCGTEATDDCTPHVGAKGTVKVDGLVWKIQSVRTASSIGNPASGFSEQANGVYIIPKLKVLSTKDESVTITNEVVHLVADGGNNYATDSAGTTALVTEGEDTFLLEDIGPNNTLEGNVVFDVPKSILGATLELEFGELGFGSTTGFIALPKL